MGKYLNEIEAGAVKTEGTTVCYVQIGSFLSLTSAFAFAEKEKKAGFPAIVKTAKVLGVTCYRVQIGAFSKKENAKAQAEKAKAKGFSAVVRQTEGSCFRVLNKVL